MASFEETMEGIDAMIEEEDAETFDEDAHEVLLDKIAALDGKKRSQKLRNEATEVSEFNIKVGEKVKLHDMIAALSHTAAHGKLKKQIKKIEKKSKKVAVPLPRLQQEKAVRSVTYDTTKKDVSKWQPIIEENRKAEQMKFPLNQPDIRVHTTTEQLVKQFKPRTPLEVEVAALLNQSDNVLHAEKILTPAEEKAMQAMSLEEAQKRRAELQKFRALLSYKEAKARRQNKIKSKKYHRILRKEKMKKEKRALEELQEKDPEAYVDEITRMDNDRIKERMSLKHRGGSKFMKRQTIFGKYDDEGRQAIQDMIQKSKQLTQKMVVESDSDDVTDDVTDPENEADTGTDAAAAGTGKNPWMAQPTIKKPSAYKKPQAVVNIQTSEEKEEESEGEEVDNTTSENKMEDSSEKEDKSEESSEEEESEIDSDDERKKEYSGKSIEEIFSILDKPAAKKPKAAEEKTDIKPRDQRNRKRRRERKRKASVSDSDSDVSDDSDEEVVTKPGSSSKGSSLDAAVEAEEEEGLGDSLVRRRTLEDFKGNWDDDEEEEVGPKSDLNPSAGNARSGNATSARPDAEEVRVDPKKFLTVETSLRQTQLPNMADDSEGELDPEEQQRMTIAQAFAADDVMEEFSREKGEMEDKQKVKDIDLTLPGWGDWGGAGIKPSKRKRKRFRIKAPQGPPRRDKGLDNVIISETKDNTVSKHQVANLPFPFSNVKQFESSIRQPIGKTWNPETAFKQLVKPKVVTRLGTVIEPINKAETFKHRGGKQEKRRKNHKKAGNKEK